MRELVLPFLFSKNPSGLREVSPEVSLTYAFAISKSLSSEKELRSLSKVSVPFWAVQVSERKSILLSGGFEESRKIELTENLSIGEIRRRLANEIVDVKDIPEVAEASLELLGNIEVSVQYIKYLVNPEVYLSVGNLFREREIGKEPNRVDSRLNSQIALDTSEKIKLLVESTKIRLASIEELAKLAKERLRRESEKLGVKVESERVRLKRREQILEEIEDLEVSELVEQKNDRVYRIRENHKLALRALTAELARETSAIEGFFTSLLYKIRETRSEIGQKGEDIQGAIEILQGLSSYLKNSVSGFEEPLKTVDKKSRELLQEVKKLEEQQQRQTTEASRDIDEQIRDHRHRIVEFTMERDQKLIELEEIRERVKSTVTKFERAINERLEEIKREQEGLLSVTFESDQITNLAPLSRLDITCFVVTYNDESIHVLTPCVIPEERLSLPVPEHHVDVELTKHISAKILSAYDESPAFREKLSRACVAGNVLSSAESQELLTRGLKELQREQMLTEGVKERIQHLWNKSSGRCPKCGAVVESGKYCPDCGTAVA